MAFSNTSTNFSSSHGKFASPTMLNHSNSMKHNNIQFIIQTFIAKNVAPEIETIYNPIAEDVADISKEEAKLKIEEEIKLEEAQKRKTKS